MSDDTFDQLPRHGTSVRRTPRMRSSAAALKTRFYVLLFTLVGAAGCGVVALVVASGANTGTFVDPSPSPVSQGFATIVADDFLSGRCTSQVVAVDLDPCFGFKKSALPTAEGESEPRAGSGGVDTGTVEPLPVVSWSWRSFQQSSYAVSPVEAETVELHRFSVLVAEEVTGPEVPQGAVFSDDGAALWDLTVTTILTEEGPVLAATPTFMPALPRGNTKEPADFARYGTTIPAAATERINEWAAAYAAGDSAALQTITNDPNAGTYLGLGGWAASSVTVSGGGIVAADGNSLLVRARVSLTRPNGFVMEAEYDLLVDEPNSTRPKVVAWGPAGSGFGLQRYGNKINP